MKREVCRDSLPVCRFTSVDLCIYMHRLTKHSASQHGVTEAIPTTRTTPTSGQLCQIDPSTATLPKSPAEPFQSSQVQSGSFGMAPKDARGQAESTSHKEGLGPSLGGLDHIITSKSLWVDFSGFSVQSPRSTSDTHSTYPEWYAGPRALQPVPSCGCLGGSLGGLKHRMPIRIALWQTVVDFRSRANLCLPIALGRRMVYIFDILEDVVLLASLLEARIITYTMPVPVKG